MHAISNESTPLTLILGATGKTGRRVADRLEARNQRVRRASRSASPSFDWNDESGWDAVLENVHSVYITYAPDLAIPGATDAIRAFTERAKTHDAKHLVLLSGRGEAEAQECERIVMESGIPWTVVRASWFYQNFSEGAFTDMVLAGHITLPADDTPEPFVDADDIADVVVEALTRPSLRGEVYEVTGPRMLTFRQVAQEISAATGRTIQYHQVPHKAFVEEAKAAGAPEDVTWMLDYLFSTVLDGRNAHLTDGIQRAIGRKPTDFSDYAKAVAEQGIWDAINN